MESDSLSEASGDTTTETDHPTETVTDSVSDVTMTLTETSTDRTRTTRPIRTGRSRPWAPARTISGGSDCFTVNDLDTSGYVSSGSGPENYNDTSSIPNGTATVTGSGSSSNLTYQTFGDILGSGGGIASGSLSYTVTSSDTDAATTIESGTETIADELRDGPSQTASYNVSTTTPDNDTAYETGTETLGEGGTISGGTASFTWSDGNSLNRRLTISGIAAILSITENSTDTYGFGESGTETITTGGADAPGTVSFVWNQMGTDSYSLGWGGNTSLGGFTLNLGDTVSSSWHDVGADELTDGDSLIGETDAYTWNDSQSLVDSVSEGFSLNSFAVAESDNDLQTYSVAAVGCDTFAIVPSECESFSLLAYSDSYAVNELVQSTWSLYNWSLYSGSPTESETLLGQHSYTQLRPVTRTSRERRESYEHIIRNQSIQL